MLTTTLLATALLAASPQDETESEAELRARAMRIHFDALTLDTHKDIRPTLAREPVSEEPERAAEELRRDDPRLWGPNQVDFPKMRAGGLDVAFFIVYVGQGPLDEDGFENARYQADAKFDAIERMARRFPGHVGLARSADDVERIAASGRLVACIGIENGYAMGTDLRAIAEFHARGARYMSITHNRHSQLGDSNTPQEGIHGGLSDLGRKAIDEMNRVGIMVDVSHASKETTLQTIARSKAPVIASHSSTDAVLEHGRNLSDDELRAIKENRGVVQCVAFASYVKDDGRRAFIRETREELGLPRQRGNRAVPDDPEVRAKLLELRRRVEEFDAENERADVSDFVDHIDHAVEVAGIDHVGISSDFDGGGGVVGWNDASETPNVTIELVRRGYTEEQIGKLWSGNTLRVLREVEDVAERLGSAGTAVPPTEIAFTRGGTLCCVDPSSGEARTLFTENEYDRPLAWTSDGASLLHWNHGNGAWDLWALDPATGERANLTGTANDSRSPVSSPDGSRIAFMRGGDGTWVMDADGSNQRKVSEHGHRDEPPAWSPSAHRIALTHLESSGEDSVRSVVYVVDLESGEETRLGSGTAYFFLNDHEVVMEAAVGGGVDLTVVDVRSGARHALVETPGRDGPASLSPDRSRIAWLHRGDDGQTVWSARVDGTDAIEIGPAKRAFAAPSFSPDSAFVAYGCEDESGESAVWITPASRAAPRRLAEGSYPVWRPGR